MKEAKVMDDGPSKLEDRRAAIKKVMDDRKGRDVEYGRFCGKMKDVHCIIDREEQEENPLQLVERMCPAYGAVRYSITIPNNIPLIHGTAGCAALHKANWAKLGAYAGMPLWPIPTTAMGPDDVFFGAEDKLKKAIVEADQYYKPDMISVIKTCGSAIIGDNVTEICHTLKDKVNCKLLPIDCAGFASRNQGMGQDRYLAALAENIMEKQDEIIPNSVNYLGETYGLAPLPYYTDSEEIKRVFDLLGIKIHCYIPGRDPVSKIVTAPKASLNVQRCMNSAMGIARVMEERFGTPYVATCVPIGIDPTTEFFLAIIEALGLGREAERIIEQEVEETRRQLEPYRKQLAGKTFALTVASGRTTSLANLFMELDMIPVYVGFHFILEKTFPNIEILTEKFRKKGVNPLVLVEPSFYEEEKVFSELHPDVFFCDFGERHVAFRHGVVPSQIMGLTWRGPWLGYRGTVVLANQALNAINNPLFKRFGRKMFAGTYASEQYIYQEKGEWA
jgi:nitrogenase molybdenum-iron protein alpha/beta subunit